MKDNIEILSNQFIWDGQGRAISVKEPVIHIANKDQVACDSVILGDRDNLVLLGDSVDDLEMVSGVKENIAVKFGFLNGETRQNQGRYSEDFDVVITGDGTLAEVNKVLNKVI